MCSDQKTTDSANGKDTARPRRRRGLEAIVPGKDPDTKAGPVDIPTFDLGQQIRAEDRRITASRRKGPKAQQEDLTEADSGERLVYSPWRPAMTELQQQVISEIVSRDIDTLTKGQPVFER